MSGTQDQVSAMGLRNNYHRPNQNWECGNLQFGCPCAHGPSTRGKCLSNTECSPVKDEDTWLCARPAFRGGSCEKGPDENGNCCQARPVCAPKRSLRYRRRMFCIGLTIATVGLLMILVGMMPLQEIIVPGPLSSGHAELLMHQGADRCAACHANAHQSVGQWVGQWVGFSEKPTTTQSQLCMECHKATMSQEMSTFAHNQSPEKLRAKTLLVSNRPTTKVSITDAFLKADFNPSQEISCSTCHREHHGKQVDMKAMTDLQCQSCHVATLGHFEATHPAFELTAGAKTPSISFDHKTHGLKHFAQANQEFHCSACHRDDASGNVKELVPYESACASCHDGPLQLSSQKGMALLQLPMIDPVAIKSADVDLGFWPSELSADFDGKIEGITRMLLEADPQARQAFYILGDDFAWMDLDPKNQKQMQAVGDILLGVKRLLVDLSARGTEAIEQRLQVAFQRPLSLEEKNGLGYGLSADLFRDARQRWFPNLLQEIDLEACFPVYGNEKKAQQALNISNPVFGKIDPKFFQDLLAENPLAGPFASVETQTSTESGNANAVNASTGADSQVRQQANLELNEKMSTVNPDAGEWLAKNPLKRSTNDAPANNVGRVDSELPVEGAGSREPTAVGRANSIGDGSRTFQGPTASNGGELLVENPLAGVSPTIVATESVDPTKVLEPTNQPTVGVVTQNPPAVSMPIDSAEDLQKVDQIIAKLSANVNKKTGWNRNDQTFAIHYQVSGHADPLLRSWIQLAANQRVDSRSGQQAAIALFGSLASPTSPGTCLQCHIANSELSATPIDHPDNLVAQNSVVKELKRSLADSRSEGLQTERFGSGNVERDLQLRSASIEHKIRLVSSGGKRLTAPAQLAPYREISATLETEALIPTFSWQARYRDPMIRQFTNFNHRPHTLQTAMSDCRSCHQLIEPSSLELTSNFNQMPTGSDFHPMTNGNCASCHRRGGTSDKCMTCHSYHVGSRRLK